MVLNEPDMMSLTDLSNQTLSLRMYGQHSENKNNTALNRRELLWRTPLASRATRELGCSLDHFQRRLKLKKQLGLQGQITIQRAKKWTTPITRDFYEIEMKKKLPPRSDGKGRIDTMPRQVHDAENYRGKLNPRWVELLMGLPIGWTMPSCTNPLIIERMNYDYSEMGSFPPPPSEPSKHYGETWPTPTAK